ncbi:MAG TPA: hypothetical protein VJ508_06000 [Saprospiraceae bacterium]|nr:hypothetical protein [Saprospiraceae bacterium]
MEIIGEMQGAQEKTWYKCTRCHHLTLIDLKLQETGQQATKLDRTSATVYNPQSTFKIGESIFHNEWNDLGRVMSKTRTSDGSEAILVMFEKQGQRRLIENLKLEETAQILNVH